MMGNSIAYQEIQEQIRLVNIKFNNAETDEDWQIWNTENIKLGGLLEKYGRKKHTREKNINLILGIEEDEI